MAEAERSRLDKLLAHAGLGTRKEVKQWIRSGRVAVDGQVVRDPGSVVDPVKCRIEVDGEPVLVQEFVYFMLNKPPGVLSATEDTDNPVVTDLLSPADQARRPFPVGRLDKDTEGLLLLTNDGKLAHRLLSPRRHVPKTYYVEVAGGVTEADAEQFRQGVVLADGYRTLPAELHMLQPGDPARVEVTLYEGKFHQIKRMFAVLGKRVVYLKRLRMGSLWLDPHLPLGAYRALTEEELAALKNSV
ncbi:MAG: rRNA pseudouridine synthase [Alicyclobacillus sp.]|nr:rRNA pseudouridine synthase [Alicyclobacillus sp.]